MFGNGITIVILWGDVFKTSTWKQILRTHAISAWGLPVFPHFHLGVSFSIFHGTESAVVLTTGSIPVSSPSSQAL